MEEKELEAREKQIAARELRISVLEQLSEKGLPAGLAALVSYEDSERCMQTLEQAEKLFREEVRRQVDARLGEGRVTLPAAGMKDEDEMSDREYYARRRQEA